MSTQTATQRFVPGFIAANGKGADADIRYFIARENAADFAGTAGSVAPAMIPVGAQVHDMFDSLEDFEAGKPTTIEVCEHVSKTMSETYRNGAGTLVRSVMCLICGDDLPEQLA